jgi:hypothetical protein
MQRLHVDGIEKNVIGLYKARMFVVKIVLLFNNNKHQGGVDAVLLKTVWF